ncbi:cytochrome b (mitochondrion) [Dictyostelium discoideum]|uniref:Cytochrome b n=1 Tax=Dictyostelium discoideum TaxID=44689 RepID=CYB_DICDI|nr:cytochrome b [Dictyostelium discoideum]Q37311.1 RecName: Full=Cytochrome b; AltName: Full=Complex III subunit 3; AltName: Full=Complex III subunit III; AltName: Full=Cytochrome b-c1 complex subunit 3; AltName: Full=Ubiquinol-cytochrome-c reductase complex cytochrome b subunit [Dictyostelium discoideum]BAA03933.1 cytochrome b [Dictyostelium discoideum]BAA78061.1 cytochrome b [Dictyostelium discoideum]|eukprot:NP_050079.1 cytochrome b (mitochondrion) [Dictyostelium discoideum]
MRLVKKNVVINGIYEAGVRYPEPANISYLWNFGFFSLICLIIQLVSGILLAMHYSAHVDLAFNSIERLVREVDYGWLLRYIHANGASFFFIVVYIHMLRGLYFGSYQKPNAMLWVSGVVIFLLLIITGFLGYVLPWGQMSYWAATVITNLVTVLPVIGEDIVIWLWGGFNVDNPTLNRFFSLHYLCPFIIVGLVGLHIIFLRENGSTNPLGVKSHVDQIPFTPYFTIKDLFSFMIFLVLFFTFVFFAPNYLGHPDNYLMADSNVTPAHIVPEWYLLPFYAMLRSIPNKVLGVLALVLAIVVLAFLPFLTIAEVRSSYFRKIHKHLFWSFLALCFFLGFLGSQPAAAPYLICGLYSTIAYFIYILVLFPCIYIVEKMIIKTIMKTTVKKA